MNTIIRDIFIDPPLAVARLGGSPVPQDAYVWVAASKPRTGDTTAIAPSWSFAVQQDGSVAPFLPAQLTFRDGPLIRPVCPFFEIWARVDRGKSRTSQIIPLTPTLLSQCGASVADLSIVVDAKNFKAARRTSDPNLRYGTFPPVHVRGDMHNPVPLLATSPSGVTHPLIPVGRSIPLGFLQVMKSRPPMIGDAQAADIDVERLRFRFTPARGEMYGVPDAANPHPTGNRRLATPVPKDNAFLDSAAGWQGAPDNEMVEPSDTYDGADVDRDLSLGVVDDTCEARIEVRIAVAGAMHTATAHVFVGPPDFAPDRRPFLSLADEINDRGAKPDARSGGMTEKERDTWIQDLFERVFETTTLFNVDFWRNQNATRLTGRQLAKKSIEGDGIPQPSRAMGGRDMLRKSNQDEQTLPKPGKDIPLPLSQRAVNRHRELSDLSGLRELIESNPGRIQQLVRAPFDIGAGESFNVTSMKMPPFMRNSNAEPLTLSGWQYDLLMQWVAEQERPKRRVVRLTPVAAAANKRRTLVLARVARAKGKGS